MAPVGGSRSLTAPLATGDPLAATGLLPGGGLLTVAGVGPVPWLSVVSVLAAVGSALLAAHLWTYRGKPGADWFVASLASQAVWSLAYGVALATFDPAVRWALEVVVWAAMGGTCVFFLAFALAYTGRGAVLERSWPLVVATPAVTAVVVATNPIHGLSWTGFAVESAAGMAGVSYRFRPWSLAGATVGVGLVTVGSLLLFDTVVSYGPLYRGEAIAVGLSTIPPVGALLVWLYGLGPVPELNFVTAMFVPHVALDAYAFVGSDMFEFHPATRRAGERAAIDDLGTPVVIVDEWGRVVTLNAAAETAFDASTETALTEPLDAVLGADAAAAAGLPTATASDGGNRSGSGGGEGAAVEDGVRTDAGSDDATPESGGGTVTVTGEAGRRIYSVTATPLSDGSGAHVGYTVVFQDVTAERRREQRLDVLNRVLRHNLRNDMTAVQGFTEAAAARIDDEETAQLLARARDKGSELVALGERAREVERVLDRESVREPVDLDSLFDSVAEEYAGDHEGTVTGSATGLTVRTDPFVLRTVLGALVENALVHVDAPTVTLLAERLDGPEDEDGSEGADGVAIRVVDDGPGIPEHELAVVREGSESALDHGSGLGLWLANWGAGTVGGDLEFETDSEGTTASVVLPADSLVE